MTSVISPFRYQFDESGNAADNLIRGETHSLTTNSLPFPMKEGMFYTGDVVVTKEGSTTPLIEGTDYKFVGFDPYLAAMVSKETAGCIEINDKAYEGKVVVDYHCVGGHEGLPLGIVKELMELISLAGSSPTIDFQAIRNLPAYYPPEDHMHHLESLEGLEAFTKSFRDATNAIITRVPMIDSGLHYQEQIDRILRVIGKLRNALNGVMAVQGSGNEINQLKQTMDNLEKVVTSEVTAPATVTVKVGEWDLTSYNLVRGVINARGVLQGQSVDFMLQGEIDKDPKLAIQGYINSGNPILKLSTARNGTQMQLFATTTEPCKVKAKVYAVL